MSIVVYSPPATEPLTIAEVMAHCRIDASNQEPPPGVLTCALVAPPAAGNVDNGAHRYLVVFGTADGKTQAGAVSAVVTVADKTVNGKIALSNIPLGGTLVTYREIYRTPAGGSTYLLLATISDNTTTTYTDNIADANLGAGAPSTNTTGDPLISMLITSARQAAELELNRYLITQTLDLYLDYFPGQDPRWWQDHQRSIFYKDIYEIVMPPLQSVTSITYVDTDGATQTLATDQYTVDTKGQPARIAPAYGCSWPSTRQQNNAVTIRFVAGYGAAAAVPQCIKNWMLMKISTAYQYREALVAGERGFSELPSEFFDGLLDPERVSVRTQ